MASARFSPESPFEGKICASSLSGHPAPAAAVKMGHDTWSLEFTKLKVVLSFFIEIGTDMIHSFI
jgi:hypothetical protein